MKTWKFVVVALVAILGLIGCDDNGGGDNAPPKVPVTGVTLDKEEITLFEEGTYNLVATVAPSNASNKSVSWESDNEAVATVNSSGKVTAVAKGTATITVTTKDKGKTAECTVTVKPLPTSIAVTKQPDNLKIAVGEELDLDGLEVIATYSEASGYAPEVIEITLEHITPAFDPNTTGTQTFTITYGGCTATFTVTVIAITGIEVTAEPTKTVYKIGEQLDLDGLEVTATFSDNDTEEITHTALHITGFDSATAGEKTITVTYGSHSDTFKVKVLANFTVTFNSNGGSVVAPVIVVEGDTVTEPTTPTKTAANAVYTFDGWYKEVGLTNAWNFASDTVAENGALYAKWIEKNTFELGDIGPGGGKIFYVSEEGFSMTDDNSTAYYLEAAPADMPTILAWVVSSDFVKIDLYNATAIGTGRKNTSLILASSVVSPAAQACNEYSNNGLSDWFLPSKDELNHLYINRDSVSNLGTGYYWTSTESNSSGNTAWDQNFSDGNQGVGNIKTYERFVRAIRAF